jgi:hypothetical protein
MKQIGLAILLALGLAGCTPSPSPNSTATPTAARTTPAVSPSATAEPSATENFLIQADVGFGAINASSTKESLLETFGKENVKEETIYVGDGMELPGLAIYPDDPQKRVEVFWWEEDPTKVQLIRIQGDRSQWKTAEGVSLGTSLTELEQLNGKPFKLLGLGWDFGGGVTSWDGGKLEGLTLRVEQTSIDEVSEEEQSQILGDQEVASDNPVMRKVNPRVFQLTVGFPLK